jgi:putative phosphoribosyl transferase
MVFASREDAGEKLGSYLLDQGSAAEVVLGLPRGGVIVAGRAAQVLQRPLGVLMVRKIGHPRFREFAVGAVAEHGVLLLDDDIVRKSPELTEELDEVIEEEMLRLEQIQSKYRLPNAPAMEGKIVLLVDDGLATGFTMEAAVKAARAAQARRIVVAAPVASSTAVERLEAVADAVEICHIDPEFQAVGRYYDTFPQATDEEVIQALRQANATLRPAS